MPKVSVRELNRNTSEILRRVREEGEVFDITYYGEVVARLIPVKQARTSAAEIAAHLVDMDQLSAEVSAKWPAGVSALDAVREVRREL